MSVLNKLASALGRRDEVPNQELAKQIAKTNNANSIKELVENLSNKKDIANDCIKVLYEIGEIKPVLISPFAKTFIDLLKSKNNRLQWGAMHAINTITLENSKAIYKALPEIIDAANKGTVITKDHTVNILVKLSSIKQYADDVFSLLIEQIIVSPVNQLPSYAEKALPLVNENNKMFFLKTLTSRLGDIDTDTKLKRMEKIIRKLTGK